MNIENKENINKYYMYNDKIFIYKYSVLRRCWCIRGRHRFKGIKQDTPFNFCSIPDWNFIEIQHFQSDVSDLWISRIRCLCGVCGYKRGEVI